MSARTSPTGLWVTRKLLYKAVPIHKVCYCLKSLLVHDTANEMRLTRTGTFSLCIDRDQDEVHLTKSTEGNSQG